MKTNPQCYGGMFPDLSQLRFNHLFKGQTFFAQLKAGGIGIQKRTAGVEMAAWEKCLECPDYATCYDLSTAKLLLAMALR